MKKLVFHPVSILIWLWLLFVLGFQVAVSYILAIIVHEYGHYFVAKHLGYKLNRFSISPYGVSLSYLGQNLDSKDELKIASAGPFANLISVLLVLGLWWVFPNVYFFTEGFVKTSMLLALFNLLPSYPLDGGRIFICLSSCFMTAQTAKKLTIAINVILSFLFLLMFAVCLFINFNPSYILFSFFLICGGLDLNFVSKYEKINVFCKNKKNFSKPCVFIVYPDAKLQELLAKIQTSKTIVFNLVLKNGRVISLSEEMIITLALNYDYESEIGQLINNK